LTGSDANTAANNATVAYGIEKQLAASHRTNIELRDVKANYNKLGVTALSKKHLTSADNIIERLRNQS
jgi:putative endopeptidase